jgi:hypothetical protein
MRVPGRRLGGGRLVYVAAAIPAVLDAHSAPERPAGASVDWLAERLDESPRVVKLAVRALRHDGLVTWDQRSGLVELTDTGRELLAKGRGS